MPKNDLKVKTATAAAAVVAPELVAVEGAGVASGVSSFNGAAPATPGAAFSANNDPNAAAQGAATKAAQTPDGIEFSREKGKNERDEWVERAKAFNDSESKAAKKRLDNLRQPHQPAHDLNSLFEMLMFIFKKAREEKVMRSASERNGKIDGDDMKSKMDALQTTTGMMNASSTSDNLTNIKNSLADMARQSDLPNMLKYPLVGAGTLIKNIVPDSAVGLGVSLYQSALSWVNQGSAASALGSRNVNREPAQTNAASAPNTTQPRNP